VRHVLRPYRESLLAAGERTALITRPHPFTFLFGAVRGGFLALLFLAAALAVEQLHVLPASLAQFSRAITIVLLVGFVLSVISALAAWLRWRNHEIVVTDRRVIRIVGFLSKEVIDYSLDAITDMRLRQSWVGRIFDYGDVDILTASEVTARSPHTFPVVKGPIAFMHAVEAERERRKMRQGMPADPDPRLTDTQHIPLGRGGRP
jgi:uncharacterized membrane protein YdbT with pleckstrin-like domain